MESMVAVMDGDTSRLTDDLLRAQARLALIARMARHNLEQSPSQQEFSEILRIILAACETRTEH